MSVGIVFETPVVVVGHSATGWALDHSLAGAALPDLAVASAWAAR